MKNNRTFLEKLLDGAEVEWRTLGEVSELRNTGVDKKINESEKSVRLLNFTDVFNNQYLSNSTPTMIVTASDKKIIDCNILKGDLFITPTSEILDEIGQSAVALENIDNAVYSYHIMRIRIHDTNFLLPEFLNYLFRTSQIKQQIRKNAQGITRFGLTLPRWKSLVIPIPPLSVQTEIVKILDALTALTSELTSELTLRRKQYEYYREKLLSVDNLKLSTEHIQWVKLNDLGELIRGNGLQKKDFTETGVPAIHYGQIYTYYGTFATETKSFVSPELAKKLKKVDCGDVVITNTSENFEDVGKAMVYLGKEQAVTGGHATIFKPNHEKILSKYFVYLTQTSFFTNEKRKYAKGTKVIDVSATDMAKIILPIPPLKEQQRIVSILDKFETLSNSITEGLPLAIEQSQKRYEYYRELLLSF